jgi:hypothetical protein
MDWQPNHPPIFDVSRAAVHDLLSCVCLDHRALRVVTVEDVSVEGRQFLHNFCKTPPPIFCTIFRILNLKTLKIGRGGVRRKKRGRWLAMHL